MYIKIMFYLRVPIVAEAVGHRAAGLINQWNLQKSVYKTY